MLAKEEAAGTKKKNGVPRKRFSTVEMGELQPT